MAKVIIAPYGRKARMERFENLYTAERRGNYEAAYPNGIDLKPGTDEHESLVTEIMMRAREARNVILAKTDVWEKIDMSLTTYMKMDDAEEKIKADDERKPVAVVVPMSYAIRETLLTYLMAAFLDEPFFRYEGTGPEDVVGAMLLEMTIARQTRQNKVGLALHNMWSDAISYGFGAVGVNYMQHKRNISVSKKVVQEGFMSKLFGALGMGGEDQFERSTELRLVSEGNELIGIDPYMYLPDPNVPIEHVQKGEFAGYLERTNVMNVLSEENGSDVWFNALYLKSIQDGRSILFDEQMTGRYEKDGGFYSRSQAAVTTNPVDIVHFYWKLIPAEWDLGDSEYPETWYFAVAGDSVLLAAEPLTDNHGMIPIAVCAPDSDGHITTPTSKLETINGLQEFVDWEFKSRMHAVRKSLNDMFVVDPKLIYTQDLKNPKPGKLIRLRPGAWGKGVSDAVQQLKVNDVTAGHLAEVSGVIAVAREMSGAVDFMHGIARKSSERITATEHMDTRTGALSRLQRLAKLISMMAHDDIATMFAYNTQQYMSQDTYVKTVGEWEERLLTEYGIQQVAGRYPVRPQDLDIMFDIVSHDGTVPGGGDAQAWVQMYQIMAGNPEIAAQHDMGRVFKHIARLLGAKNLDEFNKSAGPVNFNVQSDQAVGDQVASGRLQQLG